MEQRSALPSLNGRPPEVGVVLKAEVPVTRPSSSVATGDAERWGFYQKVLAQQPLQDAQQLTLKSQLRTEIKQEDHLRRMRRREGLG